MHVIDEENAADYLRQRGWLTPQERVTVRRLTGGVSNEVLYVSRPERAAADFVVKQARPQLRTPEPWFSSVERIWREVEVLRICQSVLSPEPRPDAARPDDLAAGTPRVLHEDRENYTFAMSAAPADHRVWKADLLGGRVEPLIAAACGRLLGSLHAGTWHDARIAQQLDDRRLYDELRLDPYYRFVARAHPAFASAIQRLIDETWRERHSLVHADFSPKNLLVFDGGLLLVDFETGHYGDPAFDLGFFLSHLVLKAAFHAPEHAACLALTSRFWSCYLAEMERVAPAAELRQLERRAVLNFAGCAWARLDGKSQVDYLADPRRRKLVRHLCQELLSDPPETWHAVLRALRHALPGNPKPTVVPDSFDLAWQAHQAGRFAEAEAGYRRVLEREPRNGRAWFVLGNLLQAQERTGEALSCFQQAAALEPHEPDGPFHVGNAHLKLQQWPQAEAAYQACLALRPDHLEALVNLGFALGERQKYVEAEACYRKALAIKHDVPEIHQNLGNALRDRGELDQAVACYQHALELRPDYSKAHVNLGVALIARGEAEAAVAHLKRGVALQPDFAEAFNSLGAAVSVLRNFAEAHAHYARAVELKADYADAHWNRALLWLLTGDFERGWPAYEWRWRCSRTLPKPAYGEPVWDGSPLHGRTILLFGEQGLGDMLQFVRYARIVKTFGGRVMVQCQRALLPLLATCPGIDQLVAQGERPPQFDVQAALMSLPLILGTRVENIPGDVPYLFADTALTEHWRWQLAPVREFRVGIAWQGNRRYPWDRHRSIHPRHFAALARVPGVRLISLQKEDAQNPQANAPGQPSSPPAEFGPDAGAAGLDFECITFGGLLDQRAGPFMDTAAIIANLDLVISVDSSVAHLAGAMAAPTWLALNASGDWRWLLKREDSPWYPTLRIFRQQRLGDWNDVFREMAAQLERAVAEAPRSPGRVKNSGWTAAQTVL